MDAGDERTGAVSTHELGRAGTGLKGAIAAEICHDIDGTSQRHTFLVRPSYLYRETGGINNKIKTMKRQAYGYRDEKFFELKILSLHDKTYAFVG